MMIMYMNNKLNEEIRGLGLAYNAWISPSVNDGKLSLDLYKASKMAKAYIMAEEIIRNHLENDNEWDENLVDSAKGKLIQYLTAAEANPQNLASLSFQNYLKGRDVFYNRNLIYNARKVTLSGMISAARQFLPSLLRRDVAQTAIVCNPTKVKDIIHGFNKIGLKLTSYNSLDDIFA